MATVMRVDGRPARAKQENPSGGYFSNAGEYGDVDLSGCCGDSEMWSDSRCLLLTFLATRIW